MDLLSEMTINLKGNVFYLVGLPLLVGACDCLRLLLFVRALTRVCARVSGWPYEGVSVV